MSRCHEQGRDEGEGAEEHSPVPLSLGELLDPLTRSLSSIELPVSCESLAPGSRVIAIELAELMGRMARRIAWGSDGRRSTARVELAAGPLAGASLVVTLEDQVVDVLLELPHRAAADGWEERIRQRLEARNLKIRDMTVSWR